MSSAFPGSSYSLWSIWHNIWLNMAFSLTCALWSPWHFSFHLHELCFMQPVKISSAPTMTEVCDTGTASWPWQQCHQHSCMFQAHPSPPQITPEHLQQRQDTCGILTPPGFCALTPEGSDSTNLSATWPGFKCPSCLFQLPTADSSSTTQREINIFKTPGF